MGKVLLVASTASLLLLPSPVQANECWSVEKIRGYSATADEGYKFSQNGLFNKSILVCFGSDSGVVTGTDVKFAKFGESTLVGLGSNDQGTETVEVYQIDRMNKKLLYVKSRVGTKSLARLFPDTVSSFVGDATKVNK